MERQETSEVRYLLVETKKRIVSVLLEMDEIKLQVNPHLKAEYARTVGYLEVDLLKWQLRARRLRRKVAILRAARNRGESITAEQVEAQLDQEFAEWEARLRVAMADQVARMEGLLGSHPMAPSSVRELKALHRILVKRLHPDIHPGQGDQERHYFAMAQAAFEAGDLQSLRALVTITEDLEEPLDAGEKDDDEAAIELAMVEAQLNVLTEELETLKSRPPYTLRAFLEDAVEVARTQRNLEQRIAEQKDVAKAYEAMVAELEKEGRDG